jgi:hypothetical protein
MILHLFDEALTLGVFETRQTFDQVNVLTPVASHSYNFLELLCSCFMVDWSWCLRPNLVDSSLTGIQLSLMLFCYFSEGFDVILRLKRPPSSLVFDCRFDVAHSVAKSITNPNSGVWLPVLEHLFVGLLA